MIIIEGDFFMECPPIYSPERYSKWKSVQFEMEFTIGACYKFQRRLSLLKLVIKWFLNYRTNFWHMLAKDRLCRLTGSQSLFQ